MIDNYLKGLSARQSSLTLSKHQGGYEKDGTLTDGFNDILEQHFRRRHF